MRSGGRIPGTPGLPAFSVSGPEPSAIPVLIAVPHAGRAYPDGVLRAMRRPEVSALKLEDRYVDRLALRVAQATDARLLVACAPRAIIDLNRAPDDVDWEMFPAASRPADASQTPSRRARGGLGVIPRRVPGVGELWKRQHDRIELADRIACIHEPYHACLADELRRLRERWGAAVLLDLHSMPPIEPRPGLVAPQFVIGDRFGSSCHGSIVAAAFGALAAHGAAVSHNRPYSGGYVLDKHGSPMSGQHAVQLEIDRKAYLDSRLAEPGGGFDAVVGLLIDLVRKLAAEASLQARDSGDSTWPQAAE